MTENDETAASDEIPEPEADPAPESASSHEGGDVQETNDGKRDLMSEGDVAADYLEGLLDIADLDGDIDIAVENDRASLSVIEVNPGELGALVGAEGEVLAALQDLTRLAVSREMGHRSRLMVDVAGFRARRRQSLRTLAAEAVEDVRKSGEPVRLEPMSAFERKVVHDAVAEAGMTSESEGTDPERYVVISPA